jgi:insulysin
LDVNVGSALDPRPLYGTAHFLEHMLFMGTEKYPSENEYSEYVTNNGGANNAYTSLTNTNYQFDSSNEGFEGALDRFAQFFISPLLKEDSTDREMEAVDSEFNQSLQSDSWRYYSLIMTALANRGSAMDRFPCGNMKSLKQNGIREALLKYHQDYYSSNIMKLCVYGNHDIETMKEWVIKMFSEVPDKKVTVPKLDAEKRPFEALAKYLKFVPVKDTDILSIMWPSLPYTQNEYKT